MDNSIQWYTCSNTLGKVNFNMFDIAFWPGIGARGNIMIELFEEK